MRRFFALTCLAIFLFSSARVHAQDDQYLRIYSLIQEGDALKNSAQVAPAYAKYIEAQKQLERFLKIYPDWNSNVVKYRLDYLASRLAEISTSNPNVTLPAATVAATNASIADLVKAQNSRDLESQLGALQNQVRQLESDRNAMEAKLKEALRLQPAAVDPRVVARTEQELRSLQKENELLKVDLAQRPTNAAPVLDTKAMDEMKAQVAEANRKASEQATQAKALAADKAALEKKLSSLIPADWNAGNIQATQKALEETNRRLAEQIGMTDQLSLEKTALQMRVKTLMSENQVAAALRSENEILKRQVAELKALPAAGSTNSSRELAEARAQIAALQSEKEVLRLEKTALENRLRQTTPAGTIASTVIPAPAISDSVRIKQLEQERADLQKKLEAAQKELFGSRGKGAAARVEELNGQVEVLRTRLAVMETQQVAYTAEELALFQKPNPQIADARTGKKSARELPAGSMALVSAAQKDFAARRFDQAEEKYQQVLKLDDKNVDALANLAAIQLELNHYDEAEKNIQQALAQAPDDAYSLSVLGLIRFRQNQFDAALDALSRAAKLDPQNAEIQNYLGLTLSQKGMRNAAESALRKAVMIDPKYASAHYNLAVIYAMEKPPQTALAQLHYKKALAAGMAPNADLEKILNSGKVTEPSH